MRTIITNKHFDNLLFKLIKHDDILAQKVNNIFEKISKDVFDPSLKTHKLKGDLKKYHACSINFSIRVIFRITDECVFMQSIGSHDEVY